MTFVPKNNSLTVNKNNRKQDGDRQPDYRTTITLITPLPAGVYEAGLWIKENQYGQFMAGDIKPKPERFASKQVDTETDFIPF